jgi:hypothetical protein
MRLQYGLEALNLKWKLFTLWLCFVAWITLWKSKGNWSFYLIAFAFNQSFVLMQALWLIIRGVFYQVYLWA